MEQVPTEEDLHAAVLLAGAAGDPDAVRARRGALEELRGRAPVEPREIPATPYDRARREYDDADALYLAAVRRGAMTAAAAAMAARRAALERLDGLEPQEEVSRDEQVRRLVAAIGVLDDRELDQVAEAVTMRRRQGLRLVSS